MKVASKMRLSLWASSLLGEPLFTAYGLIAMILCKDLGASPFQITLMVMLKPCITILSFYYSSTLARRPSRLKSKVLWSSFWMRAPFLLCPFIDQPGFLIFAAVNYIFFYRAGTPAWMELIKRHLPEGERNKAFSFASALGYMEGALLCCAMGALLDHNPAVWRSLFAGCAVIGLLSVIPIFRLPAIQGEDQREDEVVPSWKEQIALPWKDSFRLIRESFPFAMFQVGFMGCGIGLMLIQPAIPLFLKEVSYLDIAFATAALRGIGYVFSAPLWARWLDRRSIFEVSAGVFLFIGLFPLCLFLGGASFFTLSIAYFLYGIGQGGSHLVWNMSGPIFAKGEDSSRYTGVSVALGGVRGAFAPLLGGMLMHSGGIFSVFALGALFSIAASFHSLRMSTSRIIKKPL